MTRINARGLVVLQAFADLQDRYSVDADRFLELLAATIRDQADEQQAANEPAVAEILRDAADHLDAAAAALDIASK